MTIVQRSPDLGINIRLQRLAEAAPVAAPVTPPLPPTGLFIAAVSFANASVYGPTLDHYITLSRVFDVPKTYTLVLLNDTAVAGVDFDGDLTDANFSNGVTFSAGEITVPAGVDAFSLTVYTIYHSTGGFVIYQASVSSIEVDVSAPGLGRISDI